ncbi:hypothetical protein G7Y79_00014g036710 [Physcia stellaris]|nr:hypothetical protein G7Y79_00014g036710 [Physcia stellaris]
MSLPWVRSAYTSIINHTRSNFDVLFVLAEILDGKQPCPGKVEDHRDWYRLKDPDNDRSVHDFQICPCCVQQLEAVLPSLRGVFHRSRGHHSTARVCSLRSDSKRFTTYVELLEEIAAQADDYRRPPNMYHFIELAKKLAEFPECRRDVMLPGQEWYYIPELREFTVCEDCYEEVVWPAIKRVTPIAEDFNRHAKAVAPSHVGVSCQLYSPRMRRIFHDACLRADMQLLRNATLQRYNIEQGLQAKKLDIQRWPREERAREMARLVEEWKRWE